MPTADTRDGFHIAPSASSSAFVASPPFEQWAGSVRALALQGFAQRSEAEPVDEQDGCGGGGCAAQRVGNLRGGCGFKVKEIILKSWPHLYASAEGRFFVVRNLYILCLHLERFILPPETMHFMVRSLGRAARSGAGKGRRDRVAVLKRKPICLAPWNKLRSQKLLQDWLIKPESISDAETLV